ncbi:MAG: laccase domain protein [Candidatus Xenobia bacterium]
MSYQLRQHGPHGVTTVVFPHLQVPHGFSTRLGGVSQGSFSALNLGWLTTDEREAVSENQARFDEHVGFAARPTLRMEHGVEVAVVERPLEDRMVGDACTTDNPEVGLSLTTADCVPIFYHDPANRAVALAHAGWRGTVAGVALTTLQTMQKHYRTRPEEVKVAIAPAIGPCCFEVDADVAGPFEGRFPGEDLVVSAGTKWRINLWRANWLLLVRSGVRPDNIVVGDLCTACRQDLFFSYRRDRGHTGRMVAAILPG